MSFRAKYTGVCAICENPIEKGDMIEWSREDHEAMHVGCLNAPVGDDLKALTKEGVERLFKVNREQLAKRQAKEGV